MNKILIVSIFLMSLACQDNSKNTIVISSDQIVFPETSDSIIANEENFELSKFVNDSIIQLISLETIYHPDFQYRDDVINNNYRFDSIWYNWIGDTLLLNRVCDVSDVCGDYIFRPQIKEDTIKIKFVDLSCDLATILEVKSRIYIKNREDYLVEFNDLQGRRKRFSMCEILD